MFHQLLPLPHLNLQVTSQRRHIKNLLEFMCPNLHLIFFYTKHTYVPNDKIIYYACHKIGPKANHCNILKRNNHFRNKTKQVWILKGTYLTNQKGSKVAWVPKNDP